MSSTAPWWWLALPVLLLPIWWHRQKRQRLQHQPLATARFLPAATPRQQRIWRWVERVLLALRCALLLALIAWLADVLLPWRGDTVFVGPQVEAAWVNAQVQQAGLGAAARLRWCADDPTLAGADAAPCDLRSGDLLRWLAAHQREWRDGARWLVLARGADLAMPAHPPRLAHALDLRVQPRPPPATRTERQVMLASDRPERWRALFAAFESAGLGSDRYVFTAAPDAQTELIVWDRPGAPDAAWRAPLWWVADAAAFPELTGAAPLSQPPTLRHADSPRGRLWTMERWPLDDLDGARTLYETWQTLQRPALPHAPPSLRLPADTSWTAAGAGPPLGALQSVLAPLLIALFALERALAHARRR